MVTKGKDMNIHKLVPVEPTSEMLAAGEHALEAGCYASGIYADMLAAAPDVQVEPMAWRNLKEEKPADGQDCITKMKHGIIQGTYSSEDDSFSGYYWRDMGWYATHWVPAEEVIYAAPQPAEPQPSAGDSLTPVPDEVFAAEFAAWWEEHGQFCRAGGGTYEQSFAFEAWRHLYPQLMNLQMAAAEQKPAPDVAGVAEDVAPLPFWEPCNPGCDPEFNGYRRRYCANVCDAARIALAAHRKQGGRP